MKLYFAVIKPGFEKYYVEQSYGPVTSKKNFPRLNWDCYDLVEVNASIAEMD